MVNTRNTLADLYRSAGNIPASAVQATAAGGAVPLAAGIAGLGGVALGAIPGSMGVPGFNQNVITDPEYPGSSNTSMARASTPTLRYLG
jgi:hypothetical protein